MEINISTTLRDAALLAALRASWQLSQALTLNTEPAINDFKVKVPVSGKVRGSFRFHDNDYIRTRFSDLAAVMERALAHRSGSFIDIGANVGLCMYLKLALSPRTPYLGVEPNLAACSFLANLIHINNLEDHQVLPVALTSTRQLIDLVGQDGTDVMATTVPEIRPRGESAHKSIVLGITGDEIINSWRPAKDVGIALIKIDVEGAELEVLRGLANTIHETRPPIVFELLPTLESLNAEINLQREQRAADLESFLRGLDYSMYRMNMDGTLSSAISLDTVPRENPHEQNYLCLSSNDRPAFEKMIAPAP